MIDVTLSFPFLVYVFEGLAGTWEGNKKKESALSTCHDHRDTHVGFTGDSFNDARFSHSGSFERAFVSTQS
jgi:hypothetical protein